MDLFKTDPESNLLPCDGTLNYHGRIFSMAEEQRFFETLLQADHWQQDELMMFGKRIITARKVAWYGDPGSAYSYSGTTKQPLAWTDVMLELKQIVQHTAGLDFNSCLLNLYHHGGEGMGWHSDDEKALGGNPCIASVSFGAERKFSLKHKSTSQAFSLILESGSLLVMKDTTQAHWLHSIPKTKKITTPRISLTFRTIQTI